MNAPVLTKKYGQVIFVVNDDAKYIENRNHIERFLFITYNTNTVSSYDLQSYLTTGNHKLVQLQSNPIHIQTTINPTVMSFEDYIMNDPWVKMAIENKADDNEVAEIVANVFQDFQANRTDSISQTEYMSVCLGYQDRLQTMFEKIRKKRDEK